MPFLSSPIPSRPIRWVMVLALAGFLVWVVLKAFTAILPFVLAFLLALIISPAIDRVQPYLPWRERHPEFNRSLAIAVVYVAVLGVLVAIGFAVVPTVADEVEVFIDEAADILDRAEEQVDGLIEWYRDHVPEDARAEIEKRVSDVGGRVGEFVLDRFASTVDFIVGGFFSIIGYLVIPFFLFYLLKDGRRLRMWLLRLFPPALQADAAIVLHGVQHTFAAYLRAQLLLAVVIALATGVGLWIMDVRFPAALALAAGVTALIPFIGPFLGFIPAIVVVLATDPEKWWWIIIFYVTVQQLEGQILVPIVHGRAVTMHPAAVMALVVIGGAAFGFAGTLLIVPAAAAVRDAYSYVYRRLNNELPPPATSPLQLALASAAAPPAGVQERAPPDRDSPGGTGAVTAKERAGDSPGSASGTEGPESDANDPAPER